MKKLITGIVLAAAAMGLTTFPAAADPAAETVWAELTGVDPALTARAAFFSHVDFSDEGGLTFYEVRALAHHLDDVQRDAIEHACDHVLAGPRRFTEQTHDFCKALDDVLSDTT